MEIKETVTFKFYVHCSYYTIKKCNNEKLKDTQRQK